MNNLYDELRFNKSAAALLDYWISLRAPGTMCPNKKDFMPMKMGKYLPDVFLAEWTDGDHVLIRVAGSRTTDVTGTDTTGNNIMANSVPGNQHILQDFYQKMRTGRFAGVSEHPVSKPARQLIAVALQLPLLDKSGNANFFVGVIKATPIKSEIQNFLLENEKKPAIINARLTNLSVHQAPMEKKLG